MLFVRIFAELSESLVMERGNEFGVMPPIGVSGRNCLATHWTASPEDYAAFHGNVWRSGRAPGRMLPDG
jgi:hypothetical protein